jgi:hypothetical protein
MGVETVYADSLEDFLARVRTFREKWKEEELWFRGVTSSRHRLRPSLYRDRRETEALARRQEDEARIEFSRRGHALVLEREPRTDLDWYVLMRHNGVPTRLLDWSEGCLIALYFALRRQTPAPPGSKPENGAVWVLDPQWLNGKAAEERGKKPKYEFLTPSSPQLKKYLPPPRSRKTYGLAPVALLSNYLLRQMLTQRSAFTIQGAPDGFERIASAPGHVRISKVVVRHRGFDTILSDLSSCGVDEATVFPDLGGLGREVTESYL